MHVEQQGRFLRLVRLQLADEVQLGIGIVFAQARPFVLRLLHPVLAEDALALVEQREDALGGMRLADRDQRHLLGFAPRDGAGLGDAVLNFCERGAWRLHDGAL
jgi:hypothetical protein